METMMTDEQRSLVEDNLNLVYWFLHKNHLDMDEWSDVLFEALCNAAIAYDASKGAFSTIATVSFWQAVEMERRKKTKRKRIPEHLIKSGNEEIELNSSGDSITRFDMIADKRDWVEECETRILMEEHFKTMKEKDLKMLLMRLDGMTCGEIAEEVGLTQSMVSRHLIRIGKGIKKLCGIS